MDRVIPIVVIVFILTSFITGPAAAIQSRSEGIQKNADRPVIRDLDGDGDPDLITFEKNILTDGGNDVVHVIDRNDNMKLAENPKEMINYKDDILLYDIGNDGTAELIVGFSKRGSDFAYPWRALIYDERDGELSYNVGNNSINIPQLQNRKPVISMASETRWVTRDRVSYNLRVRCDARIRCSFGGGKRVNIQVNDTNDDGIPEYEIRNINNGKHPSELIVNKGTEEVLKRSDGIIFPYIESFSNSRHYSKGSPPVPPIRVDWENGTIAMVGEFITSRSDEDNYFIYTRSDFLSKSRINSPSFEYPFSFHDLAGDDDGVPELAVRIVAFPKGSPYGLGQFPSQLPFDLAYVRYSWDQNNDGRWEYKVGLLGANGYSNIDSVGPYRMRKPEYENTPQWVREHRWRTVSFVARPEGSKSSEGIYTGDFNTEARREAFGLESSSRSLLNEPPQGFRVEINPRYEDHPRLYYSPVDRRLHLYNLTKGVWNRTGSDLYYENVDADAFVDWWVENRSNSHHHLIVDNNYILYADGESISFKRTEIGQSRYTTAPPTTPQEWTELGTRLSNNSEKTFRLKTRFAEVNGTVVSITNAQLVDYVPTENGFRIFANVSSDSSVEGPSGVELPGVGEVVFLFSNESNEVKVRQSSPASLSLEAVSTAGTVSRLERNSVSVQIRNSGWETAENVTVKLVNEKETVATTTLDVTGKRVETATLKWWPLSETNSLKVVVQTKDGDLIAKRADIKVRDRNTPSVLQRYQLANRNVYLTLGAGLAMLVGIVLTGRQVLQ